MQIESRELFWGRLFPRICVGCRRSGAYICCECTKRLVPHIEICPVCRKVSVGGIICEECQLARSYSYQGIIIGFEYKSLIKKLILHLKFGHRSDVAGFLAQKMMYQVMSHPVLSEALHQHRLIITYVPSHRYRRYRVKGYNQSLVLAHSLSILLGVPYRCLTTKLKHTVSQLKTTSRSQRLTNLLGAFDIQEGEGLQGDETILIIDDITTTGSTIACVADTIHKTYPQVTLWGGVVARNAG